MVTAPQAVADARDPLHRTVICAKLVTAQPSFAVTFRTRKEWESGDAKSGGTALRTPIYPLFESEAISWQRQGDCFGRF
jgi:hypothetical protein